MSSIEKINSIVIIAICTYVYVVFLLFSTTSNRKAAGTSIILGTLFLPVFQYQLPHITVLSRSVVIGGTTFLFSLIYSKKEWFNFRLKWFDWPILLWCSSSIFSSLANDLGLKDGIYSTISKILLWAIPYFIGRVYFSYPQQSRNLVLGIFAGGILYIPFCLFEIRMSPQLHAMIYGYHQHIFSQTIRYDSYRPVVFMTHGLMVAMWMTAACLAGFWIWKLDLFRKNEKKIAKVLLVILFITTFLMRSTGALLFLFLGIFVLFFEKVKYLKLLLVFLALVPMIYLPARLTDYWTGRSAVDLAAKYLGPDRAYSLAYRLDNEEMLIRKTMERPLFGWAEWNRNKIYDENGKDITTTDSMWIIAFSINGFWGVFWLYTSLILPIFLYSTNRIRNERLKFAAPMEVVSVFLALYVFDTLLNNQPNPVYYLLFGSLSGQAQSLKENKRTA